MNYILDFASVSVFIPCIPAILRYRSFPKELKLISNFVMVCAVFEIVSHYLWSHKINNLPLLHLYIPVTFTMLFLFYKNILKGQIKKRIWLLIAVVFYAFSIVDSVWLQGLYTFNSYTINLLNAVMVFFSIACFYKIAKEMKVLQLERYPVFWINTGVIFYYAGSLLLFTLSNQTISFSKAIRMHIWTVHALFVMLMYLLITVGLWIYRKS